MNVLHITTHLSMGGVTRYLLDVSGALVKKGFGVSVASSGGDCTEYFRSSGIKCPLVPVNTKYEFHPKLIIAIFKVLGYVRREKIDIIHAHTRVAQVVGYAVAALARIPFVSTCHGHFNPGRLSRKIFPLWGRKVIAVSDAVKDHLVRDFGIRADRITVIYTGVAYDEYQSDLTKDQRGKILRDMGLPEGARVIGSVGRLSPVKGYPYLLHALKDLKDALPDVFLVLIGDGPQEKYLKGMAGDLDIERRVVFMHSRFDARRYIPAFDVYVLPSVQEGLGLSLLEAMACGRPCVATAVGGIVNIIQDGRNGILTQPCDTRGLAGAIKRILNDTELAVRIGADARRTVKEKFSLEDTICGMIRFYGEVRGEE
ncbi:MAG: glycosyltransferase family 4 protein [Candidatus Omnitrophica bacterium]|nr:glycosyltransferase family 4 protein [Candidatus Omnitrophota bacterium]